MTAPTVQILNCGSMCPRPAALLGQAGGVLGKAQLPINCLLCETSDGWVLVDTGFGLQDCAQPAGLGRAFVGVVGPVLDVQETAIRQIEALGLQASDIRHIVLTHLDLDHAGGLPDFPRAQVHVLAHEHELAMRRSLRDRTRYRPQHWAHGPDWSLHAVGGERWFGFEAVQALRGNPDILLVPLAGHSLGHAGVAVRHATGWTLLAGDAYFYREEVYGPVRRAPLGLEVFQAFMDRDRGLRLCNQTRLRELVNAHSFEVHVIASHVPVP